MNEQKYMWSYAGTALLISIWSQNSVQQQLKATFRNQKIWDAVARYMIQKGFKVTGRQCRIRIKNILVRYKDAKKSGNITGTGIEPYFHDLDRVMTLKNIQSPNPLPRVPPDPLVYFEHMSTEDTPCENQDSFEVNVKNEFATASSASEDNTQESQTSFDVVNNQLSYKPEIETGGEDTTSSANPEISTSSVLNAAEKCEVVTSPSPPPQATDMPRLEKLVVQVIESQSEAVMKILTAQHTLAKKLLEVDSERQKRVEYKLDNIISRLDQLLPLLPSSATPSPPPAPRASQGKLNSLLDRLDQVLPFIPTSTPTPSHSELGRLQEDKLERILNKLDQIFSLQHQ